MPEADLEIVTQSNQKSDDNMDIDQVFVKMAVVDGIVLGPQHCAYENCTSDLANYHGGSFCALHENQWGAGCCMCNCNNQKIEGTQACTEHQQEWNKYVQNHSCQSFQGSKRMLQRPGERLPWQPTAQVNTQAHDEPTTETQRKIILVHLISIV